jgi:hypothetical protein
MKMIIQICQTIEDLEGGGKVASGPSHTISSWGFALLVIIGVSLGILIILAIIIGVGFWIYRKLKAHLYA